MVKFIPTIKHIIIKVYAQNIMISIIVDKKDVIYIPV